MKNESPYIGTGSLTREQFLFYETRTTAKLLISGLSDDEIVQQILRDNLFQYPTERSITTIARGCISRLKSMNDDDLIRAIAMESAETAKQICLYAMMKHRRLIWDFMVTVIGEKFSSRDYSFGKIDLNAFFLRLQEQDDTIAALSDSTVEKIKQVLRRILTENEYLDNVQSKILNPVIISPILENAIRCNNDDAALPAFNCFM